MFARVKKSGRYEYLQIVHNERVGERVKQRVIATLGRLDRLRQSGQLDAMLKSCGKFSDHVAVINATREKSVQPGPCRPTVVLRADLASTGHTQGASEDAVRTEV